MKISDYESTNCLDFKTDLSKNDNLIKKDDHCSHENYTITSRNDINSSYKIDLSEKHKNIQNNDFNLNHKVFLKNCKIIKDLNLFWIAISAITSFKKEEKFKNKDKEEINTIMSDVLDFYSDYIFKNRFNLMKLSIMTSEVFNLAIFILLINKCLDNSNIPII